MHLIARYLRILVENTKGNFQPIFNPLCGFPWVLFSTLECRCVPVSV
jgi:hypothetical protein